jgi:hypothetical protein
MKSQSKGRLGGYRALLLLLSVAACDALDNALEVEAPSRIPAETLDNPANAALVVNGAISDFDCALGSYIVVGGLITDELVDATPTANRWDYDRRTVQKEGGIFATSGCGGLGVYTPISTARFTADNVLAKLKSFSDDQVVGRTALIATAAAYSGYSHILLGEGFCSASIDLGPELTSQQVFERAEQKFTEAIAAARAAKNNEILNMALVGRARARLNLGKKAEAAADARLVPMGFEKVATASNTSARRQNRIYVQNQLARLVTIGPEYRSLTFEGVADPRVKVEDTGRNGFDGSTRIFAQTKYTSEATPIPIATWEEAQLIIAEAELAAGNRQAAVDIINTLHRRAGLPAFSSTDSNAIMQHIIQERRRELFLEGHRLYDFRRFNLPLTPAPGTLYPKGGEYGTTTCLPLPDIERVNNPNI